MFLSKHAQKTLKLLLDERARLSQSNVNSEAVERLTGFIVSIRNSAVYEAMPEPSHIDADGIDTSKTVLLKRGESITLTAF